MKLFKEKIFKIKYSILDVKRSEILKSRLLNIWLLLVLRIFFDDEKCFLSLWISFFTYSSSDNLLTSILINFLINIKFYIQKPHLISSNLPHFVLKQYLIKKMHLNLTKMRPKMWQKTTTNTTTHIKRDATKIDANFFSTKKNLVLL